MPKRSWRRPEDSDWWTLPGESIHSEADTAVEAVGRSHGDGVIAGRAALYDALRSRQDGDAEVGAAVTTSVALIVCVSEALVPVIVKG